MPAEGRGTKLSKEMRKVPQVVASLEVRCVLPAVIRKHEHGVFVASCPVLDVVSQGDTEQEAKRNLSEAVCLFLVSCFERGTLDEVLRHAGFTPAGTAKKGKPQRIAAPFFPLKVNLPFTHPALLTTS